MTSTFELVPAIPQVDDGKISSLSQWEDQIYIGTEDGHVLQYKIDEDKQNPGQYTFLQSRKRSLGKRKPVELHVFKDLLRIITICDGTVDMLHLVNLEITNITIPQNKNVSLFCYEKKTHLFNFCVQVKKTLYLYEFVGNFQLIKEIKLPEPALSIEWWKGVLCLGYKKEFILMEAATGTTTPLFPLERSLPLSTLIGEELILAKDELGISVNHEGNPTRGAIAWSSPPTSIATGVTAPYVVALEPKGELLEFHNMLNQTLVQSLHCPGKKLFRLSYYEGSKYTLAAAPNSIYRIIIQPLEVQVERLLLQNKVTEAIQLVETVVQTDLREDAVKKLQNVHKLAGHVLLKNLQIEEAFQSFQQSNIEIMTLVAYFPDIVPQAYTQKTTPLIDFAKKVKGDTGAEDSVEQAKTYLLEFLESKYKLDKTDLMKDINTSILKLYLNLRESSLKVPRKNLLQSFLKKTNHFHTSEIESILVERNYFTNLGLLYQGTKENKKALQLWEKLGSKAMIDKGDELADGIDQTIDLLSSIDTKESYVNSQLLWDYAKWVLLKDPYRGIKIFASKSHPTPLDPNQVVEYLSQMNPLLVQLYLEFLIFENGNKTPQHHTRLAILYVDAFRKLFASKQENTEEGVKAKAKLLEILKKSQYYDESTLLGQIVSMPLYEEHIILYSRLRQHQKALEVIVTKFKDYRRAESYCTQFKQEDDELTLSLLKVYLQEPTVEGEFIPINALRLMNSHAFELNPTKVLPLLSNKTPVSLLTEYLARSIQHNHHMYRQNQVVKKLNQAEHLSTKYKLSYMTDKVITITRERACQVCNKPIGDRFFARYPSGTLVHFKCMKDPNVDPITGEDFKRKSKWT